MPPFFLYQCAKLLQNGFTALMYACEIGHLPIVELLLKHNADIEKKSLVLSVGYVQHFQFIKTNIRY